MIAMTVAATERYQFVRELGSGAMGRVSLALDQQTKTLVAVKRLHEMIAVQGGARMRREFRSLSQIESEHVVRVLDFGEENGAPFLVMEFVRGSDLSEWLENTQPEADIPVKPSITEITRVFAGVSSALGAVHAQGVIHRDLKPENIRVTPDGTAKLMDFGLAKILEGSIALTKAGAMVGTALYMAPEQCRGQQIDVRADLYALGAVLYRALTGRPPFMGDSIVAVVLQHVQQAPLPPRTFNPDIPLSLERLILALLAKNPAERPSSALAVREALLLSLEVTQEIPVPSEVLLARADALLIAPLIGRDTELQSLHSFAVTPALSGWMALTGDIGMGKSRLLRALGETLQSGGSRLSTGEATPDDPTPLGTISRFIAGLERQSHAALDALSAGSRLELTRIAPGLGADLSLGVSDAGVPPEVARLKLFEAFTELLILVSGRGVAVFENLHWADESTLALLAHALRSPEVRAIISYRVEDLPEHQRVPKGFLPPRAAVNLAPLEEADTRSLLRSLLDGELEPALETELLMRAGGNPWVLEERLKAMLESGAIERSSGRYEWNRERSPLPESLGGLLQHRVAQLEGKVLEFARAASVLGRQFRFDDVRDVLECSEDDAMAGLEPLLRARLVAETPGTDGEGFRFTHPLYTELLRGSLMALKRRRLHSRAAKLLSQRAEPLELAEHQLAAQEFALALESGLEAGRRAAAAFAYPQAERAYRIAVESLERLETLNTATEAQQRSGLRAKTSLGEVLSFVGRNQEAVQHWVYVLEQAQRLDYVEEVAARAKVNLVRAQRLSGALESAQSLLGEPVLGEPLFEDISTELCALYAVKGDAVRAQHHGLAALSAAKRHDNLEGVVKALMGLGMVGQSVRRKELLLRIGVRVAERFGHPHLLARVWNDLGVALYGHNRAEAFSAWQVAARFAQTAGDSTLLMRLEINTALVFMQDAAFQDAEELLNRALNVAHRIGETGAVKHSRFNLALCRYGLGDAAGARAHFAEVRDHPLAPDARLWETRLELELGDGFAHRVPDGGDEGLRQLVEVQLALSFGDFERAYALTTEPNAIADWHWALARVHAGWRLGRDFQTALATLLNLESLQDPNLSLESARGYTRFVMLAVTTHAWDDRVRQRLQRSLEGLLVSPIGQLARDVAFSLKLDSADAD